MTHDLRQILKEGGLMIVESPTKAREITKFLPRNGKWKVIPTIGFMFELTPTKEVPEKDREHYGEYSVRVDDLSFDRLLTHDPQNRKQYAEIRKLITTGTYPHFYVSTDPDEAGELIGAEVVDHLARDLKKAGMDVRRASWHEITKKAVETGLADWGTIDRDKADSAEARQVYDRLFGFSVSRYLWKTNTGKSGGRAQSPCLRLIVDREKERLSFVKAEYYSIHARGMVPDGGMDLTLKSYGGKTIATGGSFGEDGKLKKTGPDAPLVLDGKTANEVIGFLRDKKHNVTDVTRKPTTRRPSPPYTTSTFQQDVGNRLGMGSKQVMQIAQKLFENGVCTYIRSDSVMLSQEALTEARSIVCSRYGNTMLPPSPRQYKNKKNVQEGHEAIRPATQEDGTFLDPWKDKARLESIIPRGSEVYRLIWQRTVASQMVDAVGTVTTVTVESQGTPGDKTGLFTASGTEYTELGWMRVYGKAQDSPDSDVMPRLDKGQPVEMKDWTVREHSTTPPARYTEPQLVAKLEDLGIGRPSTYANIVTVNQERGYVHKKGNALAPTWNGMRVAQLLEAKTPSFVAYDYTAGMEEQLDQIAEGKITKNDFLREAWAGPDGVDAKVNGLSSSVDWDEINELSTIKLPSGYQVRVNKAGAWLEDPNGPVDGNGYRKGAKLDDGVLMEEDALSSSACAGLLRKAASAEGPRELGVLEDGPYKGWKVTVRDGKYGPYAQAVKLTRNGTPSKSAKPVNQSLPEGTVLSKISMEDVLPLFGEVKLPRTLDSNFFVGIGKRGPWIGWKKTARSRRAQFMSMPEGYDPHTISLKDAKALWEEAHPGK